MDKVYLQEFADILAKRKAISKKDAEAFIRSAFDIIQEYLLSEQIVKVKGLGTFKLVKVESRESVNVNTGERFTIDSHAKVSFTPEKLLADRINKPFMDFETVVLNPDTKTEDMERIEEMKEPQSPEKKAIVDVTSVSEEQTAMDTPPIVEAEIAVDEEDTPVVESKAIAETLVAEEASVVEETLTGDANAEFAEKVVEKNIDTQIKEKRSYGWMWALLIFIVLLIVALVGWMKPDKSVAPQPEKVDQELQVADTLVEKKKDVPLTPEKVEELIAQYPQLKFGKYWIVGIKSTYVLKKGDDLSKLAFEYYGDKHLINYLIRMNHLRNPSKVGVGQEIKIPELVSKEDLTFRTDTIKKEI